MVSLRVALTRFAERRFSPSPSATPAPTNPRSAGFLLGRTGLHLQPPPPIHAPSDAADLPWWRQLTGYHWFVFFVASAAWCFDCLDQQLFILARDNAVKALSPGVDSLTQGKMSGWAMSVFVAGWAT